MLATCAVGQAHWNHSLLVDISLHSDTFMWFWANQSLLLLLNAVCLKFLVWCDRASNSRSTAQVASMLLLTTFKLFSFPILIMSVPNEGYSRNASCALNSISTFLLLLLNAVCLKFLVWCDRASNSRSTAQVASMQWILLILNFSFISEYYRDKSILRQVHTNCTVFGLTRPGLELTIYRTRSEQVKHYTTDTVLIM
jgi:membrane-associated HD superfamily phosphohydrolase